MSRSSFNRRRFLGTSALGGAALSLGGFSFPSPGSHPRMLRPDDLVALAPDIEPIVRLIEETPADTLFAAVADQIRAGLSYRSLMAALLLAGIRNIDPDNAGGTMHAVFVIHSAHQMSLDAAPDEQIIPLFFALW